MSIDAKDIYLSNNYINPSSIGYSVRSLNGNISTKKFINTLDYSLDSIKLKEIYEKVYRRKDFSFFIGKKEYSQRVINLTFKYSVKEYNRICEDIYVKNGYCLSDINLVDCIDYRNGELVAIQVGNKPERVATDNVLGKYFYLQDGVYKAKQNIKNVLSVAQLRNWVYKNGFCCDGIKYIRFKRSSGSGRNGKCLFIDEKLYLQMNRWSLCGIKVKEKQVIDLAALEAYTALTLSSIIDTLEINAENILVIDDYISTFSEDAIVTRIGADNRLNSAPEEVEISNSIWDGLSLMDKSLFKEYSTKGMLLLRNRFFKSCCFNANIQQFFFDNKITKISQLNGFTLATDISQIKLITTPSSIKYLKFGTLQDWFNNLEPLFGIVKYEKPTHYFDGKMVQTHYQLLNTIQLTYSEMEKFISPSLRYLRLIKNDPAVLRNHIKYPIEDWSLPLTGLQSKNDIVYKLLGINDDFSKTKLYADFRNDLTKSMIKNIRNGHVLVNGNYSTLLGNPIEMLKEAIGNFDGKSCIGVGNICSCRFEYNKVILGSRSPHVTVGNILLAKNVYNEQIAKYINQTEEIVCVNAIGENILQRLSGADYDSDTLLLTDDEILIHAAEINYENFLVPTSLVEAKKTKRKYTSEQKADLDIKTSVNKIGEIINFSQELNTLMWDLINTGSTLEEIMPLYCDIAKLDVMSGIEIDKAKKEFVVDNTLELKLLKTKYNRRSEDGRLIKPYFFGHVSKGKGYYDSSKKEYRRHNTSMDYLQRIMNKFRLNSAKREYEPFVAVIDKTNFCLDKVCYEQVNRVLWNIRETKLKISNIFASGNIDVQTKLSLSDEVRQDCVNYINDIRFNYSSMYWLLQSIEDVSCKDIRRYILNILFSVPNEAFYKLLVKSHTHVGRLIEFDTGEYDLFGIRYTKIQS